jgi:hypothetical protein
MWHVAMKACAAHRAAPRTFGWATSRRVRVMRRCSGTENRVKRNGTELSGNREISSLTTGYSGPYWEGEQP